MSSTTQPGGPGLGVLKRASGGFAMLAVDQREALRAMMQKSTGAEVTDEDLISFKLDAARALSPHASAILIDNQFALERAVRAGVVADSCALIASGDLFIPAHGELVGEVDIDPGIPPARARELGAVAQKLLVIWRADQPAEPRIDMVRRFVRGCHDAGLLAIIEPVCKVPVSPGIKWDWNSSVIEAARELGSLGADLYKGEVPLHGQGEAADIRRHCAAMNEAIDSEWVVLSSGVAEADFPRAVQLAIAEGASGFLAGRAVWASCLDAPDITGCLQSAAVERLKAMGELVDRAIEGL